MKIGKMKTAVKRFVERIKDADWFIDDVFYKTKFHFGNNGYAFTSKEFTKFGKFFQGKSHLIYFSVWLVIGFIWAAHVSIAWLCSAVSD